MNVTIDELRTREHKLIERLNDGEAKIASARLQGERSVRLAKWEAGWIDLLEQYEEVRDQLNQLEFA